MSDVERVGEKQEIDLGAMRHAKPRLTVVDNLYYQVPGDEPEHFQATFSRTLESDEQPYTRKISVGPEWRLLDFGWIDEPGLFILDNRGLPRMQFIQEKQPDPESLAVLVRPRGVSGHFSWRVPVGESARFSPNWAAGAEHPVEVACPGGEVRCILHALPR